MQRTPETRIVATRNRNRNMVFAMLQRVPDAHDPCFADGLQAFGISLLFGVGDKIKLVALDFPYEKVTWGVANEAGVRP